MQGRILVVEDSDITIKDDVKAFERFGISKDSVDFARNLKEVYGYLGETMQLINNYVAITLDGVLEKHSKPQETTSKLLFEIKDSGYSGMLIAASGSDSTNKSMTSIGCNHRIEGFKDDVARIISENLNK